MAWYPASSFQVGRDWSFESIQYGILFGYFRLNFSASSFPVGYRLLLGQSIDAVGSEVLPTRLFYPSPYPQVIQFDPVPLWGGLFHPYYRLSRYYGNDLPLTVSIDYWA